MRFNGYELEQRFRRWCEREMTGGQCLLAGAVLGLLIAGILGKWLL